jgi:hypothetical protein
VSQPRIPSQHPDESDKYTRQARSTLSPPKVARPANEPDAPACPRPVTNMMGILSRHPDLTKSFLVFDNDLRMVKATGLTDAEFSARIGKEIQAGGGLGSRARPSDRS